MLIPDLSCACMPSFMRLGAMAQVLHGKLFWLNLVFFNDLPYILSYILSCSMHNHILPYMSYISRGQIHAYRHKKVVVFFLRNIFHMISMVI